MPTQQEVRKMAEKTVRADEPVWSNPRKHVTNEMFYLQIFFFLLFVA